MGVTALATAGHASRSSPGGNVDGKCANGGNAGNSIGRSLTFSLNTYKNGYLQRGRVGLDCVLNFVRVY